MTGKARNLLMGERTALNVLCRASGIATKVAPIFRAFGLHAQIGDTLTHRVVNPFFFAFWGGCRRQARRLVAIKEANEWGGAVAGTRKTTPGFRLVSTLNHPVNARYLSDVMFPFLSSLVLMSALSCYLSLNVSVVPRSSMHGTRS